MAPTIHIAMWSGPRNISTAMMRSWENRGDTFVSDEPLYAAYLALTGYDHPMRTEVLAAQVNDSASVIHNITGPPPGGQKIWYQKHMAQHMVSGIDRDWIVQMNNVLLIRNPREVLLSYSQKMESATPDGLGYPQLVELYRQISDATGQAPPIIDTKDFLMRPKHYLSLLCDRFDIAFTDKMLEWPDGRRASDGVWAPHWYDSVEKSTGFNGYRERTGKLAPELESVLDACQPLYQQLADLRLQ